MTQINDIRFDTKGRIYYNIEITNNTQDTIPASFDVNRVISILTKPLDYLISVDSFRIPLYAVPLFQFQEGAYNITLEYDGGSITKDIIYIPTSDNIIIDYGIFSYYEIIESVNEAFKEAFNDLKILRPLIPATEAPYVSLKNNLLSINTEQFYATDNIDIFMNKKLSEYFTSFQTLVISSDNIQYLIKDTFTNNFIHNTLDYYKMTQSIEGISTWQTLNKILLATSSIPIAKEDIGTQENVQISVISEYDVIQDVNRPLPLFFSPKGTMRVSNMVSHYPMNQIDVNIRWLASDTADSQIILIPMGESASIKLVFTKLHVEDMLDVNDEGLNMG